MAGEWEDVPESEQGWEEVPQEQPTSSGKKSKEQIDVDYNPTAGAIMGATAGATAKAAKKAYNKFAVDPAMKRKAEEALIKLAQNTGNVAGAVPGAAPGAAQEASGLLAGTNNWIRSNKEISEAAKKGASLRANTAKIIENRAPNFTRAAPMAGTQAPFPGMVSPAAAQAAESAAQAAPGEMGAIKAALAKAGPAAMGGASKVLGALNPMLGLAGVGGQGVDMMGRIEKGDYGRAAISGLGALGSGISMIPTPMTRIGGTAVSAAAPFLNMYLDKMMEEREKKAQHKAQGGLVYLADGGLAYRFY